MTGFYEDDDYEDRLAAVEQTIAQQAEDERIEQQLLELAQQGDPEAIQVLQEAGYQFEDADGGEGYEPDEEEILEVASEWANQIEQARGHALTSRELEHVLRDVMDGRDQPSGAVANVLNRDLNDSETRRDYIASRLNEGDADADAEASESEYLSAGLGADQGGSDE
ncbi:MAG: hypothetical protein ACRDMH_03295 [Solirubrobacterales bacterium]